MSTTRTSSAMETSIFLTLAAPGRAISGAVLLRRVPLRHRFRLSQLGHAVYQLGHLRSEAGLKL